MYYDFVLCILVTLILFLVTPLFTSLLGIQKFNKIEYTIIIALLTILISCSFHIYFKNTDFEYFIKYSYDKNNIIEQKCVNNFLNEKEQNTTLTFTKFYFEHCLIVEKENIILENIKNN